MNLVAICVNIFMPWLMFCIIYWALSFSFHYQYPTAAWMIFALGLLGVCGYVGIGLWSTQK